MNTSNQCKDARHGTTERQSADAPGSEHIFEAHSCPGVTFNWDACESVPCACACHDARVMAVAGDMLALMEEMDAGLWFGPDSPQASRVHDLVRRAHGS